MADYAKDVLVDTQWVEDHLDDDSIRIVEVDENPALYAEAHIPGAIGFDWQKDLQDQVKRDFLGPEEFGELFGSRGVSNDHTDRALRRPQQLVRGLHVLVPEVLRPRQREADERPAREVDQRRAADQHRRAFVRGRDLQGAGARRLDPRAARRDAGAGRQRHQARRRALAAGVLGRADRDGRLRAGGRAALRAHPGRGQRAVGPGGQRGRHVQVRGRAARTSTAARACSTATTSWRTAASASARRTPGSCCTSCSAIDNVRNYDGSWTEWGNMVAVPVEKDV